MELLKFFNDYSGFFKINLWNFSKNIIVGLMFLINISCVRCTSSEVEPISLEAKVGSYVVFNCQIDFPYEFDIPYVIHWSKDGKKIYTWYDGDVASNDLFTGRISIVSDNDEFGKASVNLTSIRESDAGSYHCQIMFPNRSPSSRNNGTYYQLAVEGGSLIKIPPVNTTIQEGQTAFFHCIMKHPDTSTVLWFKDGTLLGDIPNMKERTNISPDGTLSIDPSMMSDLGEYECIIKGADGEEQIARAFLNIQYKAKVIYASPEVHFPYGQTALLDCHFRSNPPLQYMRWEKDGLLFDSYNVPGVYYKKENGSLFFTKVDETFGGSYTCTPYNELGTDGPSPIIHVIVQRPPVFIVQPKPIYYLKLGETVVFPCAAIDRDNNRKPTISWTRKDESPLPEGRHSVENGNLTIESIEESDRGIYECSVFNEAAVVSVEAELEIAPEISENCTDGNRPVAPHNLTAESTENEIILRWQPGCVQYNVEYTIMYRLVGSEEWASTKIEAAFVAEATISDLAVGKEYEIMVLCHNRDGDGMFSKKIRLSTKPISSTQTPAPDTIVVGTTEYSLETDIQLATDNSLELNEPEKFYDPILSQDIENKEIGPPENLKIQEKNDGYILTWQQPKIGINNLRNYLVRWWREPNRYLHGTGETIDTNYYIRHLKEDASYSVQVFSVTEDGKLLGSNLIKIDIPSRRKLKAVAIGSVVAIIFLITAVSVFIYVKRSCFRSYKSGNDKIGT